MENLNQKQKDWLRLYLLDNEMTFKEPGWGDIKAVHFSQLGYIYLNLKMRE